MKYIIFSLLIALTPFANAESFFSGEPDESDLRGAFIRGGNKLAQEKGVTVQYNNFRKIDCVKDSPKIFRCTFHYKATFFSNMLPGVPLNAVEDTPTGRFTKINGQWTGL